MSKYLHVRTVLRREEVFQTFNWLLTGGVHIAVDWNICEERGGPDSSSLNYECNGDMWVNISDVSRSLCLSFQEG